jgi:hypothetical protein
MLPRDGRGEGAINNIAEYNAALDALRSEPCFHGPAEQRAGC